MFRWLLGMSTAAAQRAQAEAERNMKAIEEERKRILDHNERNAREWPLNTYSGVRFENDLGNGPFIGDVTARKVRDAHVNREVPPEAIEVEKRRDASRKRMLRMAPEGAKAQQRSGLCIGGPRDGVMYTGTGLVSHSSTHGDYYYHAIKLATKEFGFWLYEDLTPENAVSALVAVYHRR